MSPNENTIPPVKAPTRAGAALHARLLRITSATGDPAAVRAAIRDVVGEFASATAVAHVRCDEHGHWDIAGAGITGEFPADADFGDQLAGVAANAFAKKTTQIQKLRSAGDLDLICTPVSHETADGEVVAAIVSLDQVGLPTALFSLELIGNYQRIWSRGQAAVGAEQRLNSLAAIIELVSQIEGRENLDEATFILAAQTAKYLGCARVAVGLATGRQLAVRAISGMNTFDANSETVVGIREAMAECYTRQARTSWPPAEDQIGQANRAHRVFAERSHIERVSTAPLTTPQGETIGVWLFAENGELGSVDPVRNFVQTASPRVASALQTVAKANRNPFAAWGDRLWQRVGRKKGRAALVGLGVFMLTLMIPLPYRVRCGCVVEPVERQFAVAPFDGLLDRGHVEAGDLVKEGTLLATMDGREVNLQLSAAQAKLGQASREREIELGDQNVPKVLIAQLESRRLQSEVDLLRYRRNNLELRSPVRGVVLTGSLEKTQSAPVETGQVLYEIGPLDKLRIEIEVPANEIPHIAKDQSVKVWIDGLESEAIVGSIERVKPRSELRENQNVFVAELLVDNRDNRFRPGMRGTARISGPWRPLGWNLFHKPWEFLVSRLTWW